MKKILYILLYFTPLVAIAQCYLEPNGVTTDPRNNFDNATNPLHPQFKNQFFDWTQSTLTGFHWAPNTSASTSATHPHGLPNDGVYFIYNNNDYLPQDGWELLRFSKGYINYWLDPNGLGDPNNDNTSVYFVLYNKNRSLIRVYFRLANQLADYKNFEVSLFFPEQSLHKTAIFSSAEKIISPLLDFDPELGLQTANAFFGNHKWHYADFTVMYDPCTCDNTAEISIQIRTIKTVEIDLAGHSSGTIQELLSTSNNTNDFGKFTGTMKKATDQLLSGQKYYKDMQGALAHSDKITKDTNTTKKVYSGLNTLNQALAIGDVKVLNALPYIGEALSIFNAFVGSSSTPTVKVPPMAMELSHNFTGSLTEFNEGALELVSVPGSNNIPLDNRYPLYNETIGVMNLLDKPKINTTLGLVEGNTYSFYDVNGQIVDKMHSKYTIGAALSDEPIDIVINPASNLELVEVYG